MPRSILLPNAPLTVSDEYLVARVREGDSSALAEVYARYSRQLMRLAFRITGSAQDAEDALHDVFVGLPEALRKYNEQGHLESWLKRVTARVALSSLRAGRNAHEIPIDQTALSSDRADSVAETAPIQKAIDALPGPLRLVFVLKVMEGYSHQDISTMLGITRGNSEVRLHRAIAILRRALDSDYPRS